jgi:hypothetical protein
MERLINSDSTITQLWNPITLRKPEDGGDMFSETSVLTRATQYKTPEGICNKGSAVNKAEPMCYTIKAVIHFMICVVFRIISVSYMI